MPDATPPRRFAVRAAALAVVLWLALPGPARATGTLDWHAGAGRVDADVDRWPLQRVLDTITSATGWETWVEPGIDHPVTAHFRDASPPEALRRILGDLDFALLPQREGPSKLFVYRRALGAATERVRRPKRPNTAPIATELLVTTHGPIDAVAKRLGAHVVGRLDALGAYRLRFDSAAEARDARSELARDGDVEAVETNLAVAPPSVLEPLAMSSSAPPLLQPDVSPATDKVVVGLVDTAVQPNGTALGPFLEPAISVVDGPAPASETITHGTAMGETILDGIARALDERGDPSHPVPIAIVPVDVYGGAETTNMFDVARGLVEALGQHANVVNLSLAGESDSALVDRVIHLATAQGVLVFAAAGNTPDTSPTYPAADPGVIAVTAADAQGTIAPWANHGTFVDAMAPGMNVVRVDDRAWLGTGTSFSTSLVSGWAAGLMAASRQSPATIGAQTLLRWTMTPPGVTTARP